MGGGLRHGTATGPAARCRRWARCRTVGRYVTYTPPDAGEAGDRDDERWDDDGPPGNHFSAEQVREIAAALAPLTPEVAQARWPGRTPAAEEVYLYDDDDSAAEAAMAYYGELRDLVLRLAERGEGLVVTLI